MSEVPKSEFKKSLGFWDLTFFGIASIVGAGIFSTVGRASSFAGPSVIIVFIVIAIVCGFTALCFAWFATQYKSSGSTYSYTFDTFGKITAWLVAWALILEYVLSNILVAISWSDYFTSFLKSINLNFPVFLSTNLIEFEKQSIDLPHLFGFEIAFDLPAFIITILITYICFIGIDQSKKLNNILVIIKILVIAIVILVGFCFINWDNFIPFAPTGFSGMTKGVSSIFFAYIGFDAITSVAGEAKNPTKDLSKSIIASLVISTILYILIAFILVGMVNYTQLNVGDPLSFAFEYIHLDFFSTIISFSAMFTLASVLLVYQLGQPRIWLQMALDGLLPNFFAKIHPRYKTPYCGTIVMGLLVGIPSLFISVRFLTDLTSMGTLFAFAIVCLSVCVQVWKDNSKNKKYLLPIISSRIALIVAVITLMILHYYFQIKFLSGSNIYLTIGSLMILLIASIKNIPFVPVAGFICNLLLMFTLDIANWIQFAIWLIIGLLVYFLIKHFKSKQTIIIT